MPNAKLTAYIKGMVSMSMAQARGMRSKVQPMKISPAMYSGSLRIRSMSTPPGKDNKTKGAISMAVSSPICVGVASSKKTAVRGSASMVIWPPKLLNKMENHIRR